MEPNCEAKKVNMVWSSIKITRTEDTPARKLLKEAKQPCKRSRDGQKLIWIKQIEEDLQKVQSKTSVEYNNNGSTQYE